MWCATIQRMGILTATAVALAGLGTAPAVAAEPNRPSRATPSNPLGRVVSTPERGTEGAATQLADEITAVLGSRADAVSVVVHDRRTDAVISHNTSLRNCTGSVVKVMVLVALIYERRSEGSSLTADDRELARRMITESDNDATTTLMQRAGGRSALDELAARVGMTRTQASAAWGRTVTTAEDQVRLLDAIIAGTAVRGAADRRYVLDLMAGVIPEQRWGAGTVPEGARVQLKNGWVELSPRGWRVNSIGHVVGPDRDYTIAMLSYDNASVTQGRLVLDAVSRVVYDGVDDRESAEDDDGSDDDGSDDSAGRGGLAAVSGGDVGRDSQDEASGTVVAGARPVAAGRAALPSTAPTWLESPGSAFPPYPVW